VARKSEVTSLALPFEAIFEILIDNANDASILELFHSGKPSFIHKTIADLCAAGIVHEVFTTNFDLLIEQAILDRSGKLPNVFKKESEFLRIEDNVNPVTLVKLHGSVDDLSSIRATLRTVASRVLSEARRSVVKRIFDQKARHHVVVIIGYSCSDVFDIVEQVSSLHNPFVDVILIQHSPDCLQLPSVNPISNAGTNNPFVRFKGLRIETDTTKFIEWYARQKGMRLNAVETTESLWPEKAKSWVQRYVVGYLKYTILGQLFYRTHQLDRALRYYQRSLEANPVTFSRGYAATLTNIGLVLHDMERFSEAIDHHAKALSIFQELQFSFGIAGALNNAAWTYIQLKDFTNAEKHLRRALRVARPRTFRESTSCEADALSNMGLLCDRRGNLPAALSYYLSALTLDEDGNPLGAISTLESLAKLYAKMGKWDDARVTSKRGKQMASKLGRLDLEHMFTLLSAEAVRPNGPELHF